MSFAVIGTAAVMTNDKAESSHRFAILCGDCNKRFRLWLELSQRRPLRRGRLSAEAARFMLWNARGRGLRGKAKGSSAKLERSQLQVWK